MKKYTPKFRGKVALCRDPEIRTRQIQLYEKTNGWVYGDGIHYPKSFNYDGTVFIDGGASRANDWVEVEPDSVGFAIDVCAYDAETDENTELYTGDVVLYEYTDYKGVTRTLECVVDTEFGFALIANPELPDGYLPLRDIMETCDDDAWIHAVVVSAKYDKEKKQ